MEFPGPGFTSEQWEQLKALAVSMKPGQALWISGYFAGLDHAARGFSTGDAYAPLPLVDSIAPSAASQRALTILCGSETGNSAELAGVLRDAFRKKGVEPALADMASYKVRKLKDEQDLIIITSTHGEGDPPLSGMGFFEFVEGRKAPKLPDLKYAVLALGDSTYEFFCGAGKRLDERLAELGATRLSDRVDCDVDYEEPAAAWMEAMLGAVAPIEPKGTPAAGASAGKSAAAFASPAAALFDKRNPFSAPVIDNIVLTGRGSTKETRHIELSLADSGLAFEPGDALGVVPSNDPILVETLIETLSLAPDAAIEVKGRATSLQASLLQDYEISAATPRFIDHWAALSGSDELAALGGDGKADQRAAFLRAHHVVDIVRRFPVAGLDAQSFVSGLRPLQPRLYSIASSLAAAPDEAHLTVSTVRYDLHGQARTGVASGHLAQRSQPDEVLPVYVQTNPHFRLPADDAPIIMVGAGTGVAPYRGFLQQREALGSAGKSWLFFGERHSYTDFLYQTEWQAFLKDGVLSRMNVAFSRDHAHKTYVQHRLCEQGRDVYAWLEEGAHFYICGDGAHLAPDVHAALNAVIRRERNCGEEEAEAYLAALRQDHRYHIDVY
jgi:sulfite reductase (NADPH) flavoprotein alpha-component